MSKSKKHLMKRLNRQAKMISYNRGEKEYTKLVASRKLFVQEKRVWPSGVRVGWKRGEIFEVLQALLKRDFEDALKEWGDVGYYIASSYKVLQVLYCLVTPESVLKNAVNKFYNRAVI